MLPLSVTLEAISKKKIMKLQEIADALTDLFAAASVHQIAPGSWQVEAPAFRLLVMLSEDDTWLRILIPIVPEQEALPFLEQFMEANFDETQEVRYALHQGVVWGVFQHNSNSLVVEDFRSAIARLISFYEAGLDKVFNRLVESRVRQIIIAAKQQGQSLQATMQNLDRFYAEGLMGDSDQTPEAQEEVLAAWRRQLERLWDET